MWQRRQRFKAKSWRVLNAVLRNTGLILKQRKAIESFYLFFVKAFEEGGDDGIELVS